MHEWTEPILFDSKSVPRLSPELFPKQLSNYVMAVSETVQVPVELVILLTLPMLATAAQRKFVIRPYGNRDYFEPVNLWAVAVLPPASRKTEVYKRQVHAVVEWQRERAQELAGTVAEQAIMKDILEKRIMELKKRAAAAKDEHERGELAHEATELQKQIPAEIILPRLFAGDVTPERLQDLLAEQGGRMSILADEGGIFEVMAGLYNDGRANIDVFLGGHAGSPCVVERAGRNVNLTNPALTFGLTVQPQIIRELSKGSKRKFRGLGCLARFIYAIPVSNIGSRDVRKGGTVPQELQAYYDGMIAGLLDVPLKLDEHGRDRPIVISLDTEAQELLYQFADYIEQNQGDGRRFESIQDWTGKLPGAAARIIALCHIAEFGITAGTMTVSAALVKKVIEFCTNLIAHAQAAFDMMQEGLELADAKSAFKWLQRNWRSDEQGRFYLHENELYRSGTFKNEGMQRCTKALEVLKERGIVSQQCKLKTKGRSMNIRYINPALQERFAPKV
jgi:putative DNA primase/helicase